MEDKKYDIPDFGPDADTEDMPRREYTPLPETTELDFPGWELYINTEPSFILSQNRLKI
jgi:hypothetical protein